ncbi:uroporphyrinogen-III synthase [Paenibacillus psychroresistens]|uniref:Uroporphyrinogen-III synthase n=1 Tax=Paenibacillus psychroresistens TaxID=1778678 RepID=A0A6B8RU98_9BACL|nr:uroporphyrinogen-III synthase [Paenibacillus psychroresistens]QGQ99382.1 uroporphyrinogen-III synthase [Paenibacillus psychroresistens]
MGKLEGKRVALTGPRRAEDLSKFVVKLGGIPLIRPAQGTVFLEDAHVEDEIRRLLKENVDWFIFTTGLGIETLLRIADNMELLDAFMSKLKRAKLAARGYKAIGALKKLGLETMARDDDGTSAGLVRALAEHDLTGCRVALQLHGDPAPKLVQYLQEQNAEFREILPYRHVPPEREVLVSLVAEILNGEIDAVTFTSGPQVRFIFAYAAEQGVLAELLAAFAGPTVAVAVGKYTADVVREAGVSRVIYPQEERMGNMILAFVEYLETHG